MARDWKSIALLSLGFSVGVAYTVACGDKNPGDAHADEGDSGGADTTGTVPPPGGYVGARAVVEVDYGATETFTNSPDRCSPTGEFTTSTSDNYTVDLAALEAACCPSGFSFVGWRHAEGGLSLSTARAICLEDI